LDPPSLIGDHPLVEPPDGFYLSPELQRLNPPPSAGEDAELAELLRIEGCTDRLVVWREARVLIDGYRRYRFSKALGKPFEVREVSLPDWAAAEAWIIAHQSARRNATKAGRWYLIGRTYLLRKGVPGGTGANQHNKAQRVHSGPSATKTVAVVALKFKVSTSTVKRAVELTEAVDQLTVHGDDVKELTLSCAAKISRNSAVNLVQLPVAEQRRILDHLRATGELLRPWLEEEEEDMLLVPREPKALALAVTKQLGLARAKEARAEMDNAIARAEAKLKERRRGPAGVGGICTEA
jgi:hypothetical protein